MFNRLSLVLLLTLLCIGCENQNAPPSAAAKKAPAGEAASTEAAKSGNVEPAATKEVTLTTMGWQETQQLREQQKGKVVVIDVWSTFCPPCMREFPNLVKLHEDYGDQVYCISFNIDFPGGVNKSPEDNRERVMEFLRRNNSSLKNVLSSDPDEEINKQLGAASIPVVLVYDREGQLAESFNNDDDKYGGEEGFTYGEHIRPLVEKLLRRTSESGPPGDPSLRD